VCGPFDALAAQGFEVFWDQEVPTGLDWDSWIRQHLAKCKCAMAFWSAASVASDNVRHEAMVAKQQGKLISVLLEPLTIQQFREKSGKDDPHGRPPGRTQSSARRTGRGCTGLGQRLYPLFESSLPG
jgi:hypothetical protein